jgi:hypothetical protein
MNVAKVGSDVTYVAMNIHVCCGYLFKMFHLFRTYVADIFSVCCIYYSSYTHMLQAYVLKIQEGARRYLEPRA